MARKSKPTILSELQKNILLAITKRHDSPQQLARRARIVLLAAEGQIDPLIAPPVGLSRDTVFNWRTRWNKQAEQLAAVEAEGDEKALRKFIVEGALADDPYNGKRGKYTPEQITQLYAIACENPDDSGRPISHWSLRELGEEMAQRGIVDVPMPITTVWEFLKSGRLEAAQGRRMDESQGKRPGRISATQ